MRLQDLQDNYQSRIKSFEERHFKRFDDLRLENSKLRSRLMEKVTLITKNNIELNRLHSKARSDLKFKMKSILQARANAQLILIPEAALRSKTETFCCSPIDTSRPPSAPGTSKERHKVCMSALKRKQQESKQLQLNQ